MDVSRMGQRKEKEINFSLYYGTKDGCLEFGLFSAKRETVLVSTVVAWNLVSICKPNTVFTYLLFARTVVLLV